MSHAGVVDYKVDHFCLKTSISGNGPSTLVIGSHIYYPRTFSKNLKNKLLICLDTRAFTNDHPAHTEADFTLDKIIEDVEAIRFQNGLQKVILVGHSIHAFMALEYASRFPHSVSHLVLMASSPMAGHSLYTEADRYFEESVCPDRKAELSNKIALFMNNRNPSFTERMLNFGPRLWYNYTFDANSLYERVEVNTIGADLIWGPMFEHYPTGKILQKIQCPVFLALGRYDYFNPPHLWEKYRNKCTDLTIRIFEKSGHTPQFEEQENFDNEFLAWLEQNS